MRLPVCAICSEFALNNDKKNGLVHFTLTEGEKKTNERFKEPGFVEHPAGREWFLEIITTHRH